MEGPNNHGLRERVDLAVRHIARTEPRQTPRQSASNFTDERTRLAEAREELHTMPAPDSTNPNAMASYRHFSREQAKREQIIRKGVRQPQDLVLLDHLHLPWRSRPVAPGEDFVKGESNPLLDDLPDQSGDLWTVPQDSSGTTIDKG